MTPINEKLVPELRFGGFNGVWEEKKIENIGKIYSGLSGKTKNDFGNGEHYYIEYMDVFKNNASIENLNNVKIEDENKHNKVEKGDILFTLSSETIKEVGLTTMWDSIEVSPFLNSFCIGLKVNDKNVNSKFLNYLFRNPLARREIMKEGQGITRINLSQKRLKRVKVKYPISLPEQKKIASFFTSLDKEIEILEKKIDLLKKEKKGFMQRIFDRELRFKDENGEEFGEWEEEKLKEFFGLKNGYSFKSNNFKEYGIPLFKITNIGMSFNKNTKDKFAFIEENPELERFKLNKGNVLIALSGATTGKVGVFLEKEGYLNQRVGKFEPKKDRCDERFLRTFTITKSFRNIINKLLVAGAQPNLSTKELLKMKTLFPSLPEQQKIADFFTTLDKNIEKHEKELEMKKELKKAFMQRMFV